MRDMENEMVVFRIYWTEQTGDDRFYTVSKKLNQEFYTTLDLAWERKKQLKLKPMFQFKDIQIDEVIIHNKLGD